MKEYQFNVIRDDLSVYESLQRIWASTAQSALNFFCTKRYGNNGFDIVSDKTVYGCHANSREEPVESVEVR